MTEIYHGPVEKWKPNTQTLELIARLEASDQPLDQAYAEAYRNGCFICEFGGPLTATNPEAGITGVGDLNTLIELELRHNLDDIDIAELTLGDCLELTYPGLGATRVERVLDGMRQVIAARQSDDIK